MYPTAENKFERGLVGEPQAFGEYTIQPAARLTGRNWQLPDGYGGGALVRIVPTEVTVRDRAGVESTLEIKNADVRALQGMLGGALALAAFCLLIMAVSRRLTQV